MLMLTLLLTPLTRSLTAVLAVMALAGLTTPAQAQSQKTAAQVVKAIQVIQGDSPVITIRSGQSIPIRVRPSTIVTTINKVAPPPAPAKRPTPNSSPFFTTPPAVATQKPAPPPKTANTVVKAGNLPNTPMPTTILQPGMMTPSTVTSPVASNTPLVLPPQWSTPQRYQQSFSRIYPHVQKLNKQLTPQDAYTMSKGIEVFSHYYNLDPKLVASLVTVESSFRPAAISSSGAIGLGQLKPTTAQWLGVRNPYDPLENLLGTAKYLRFLLNKYNGNTPYALAAYYQGQGTIDREGLNDDSRYYISKIAKAFQTI